MLAGPCKSSGQQITLKTLQKLYLKLQYLMINLEKKMEAYKKDCEERYV